jgi:hypothetical protein
MREVDKIIRCGCGSEMKVIEVHSCREGDYIEKRECVECGGQKTRKWKGNNKGGELCSSRKGSRTSSAPNEFD